MWNPDGLKQWFSCEISRPAALASPGTLLEKQILSPQPRPAESEIAGWNPKGMKQHKMAISVFIEERTTRQVVGGGVD